MVLVEREAAMKTPFLSELIPREVKGAVRSIYGQYDGQEFLGVRVVKRTTFEHQCFCVVCGPHKLPKGSSAVVEAGRENGKVWSCYTCEACAIMGHFFSEGKELKCETVRRRLAARRAR